MIWNFGVISSKEKEQARQELDILKEDVVAAYEFFRENRKDYFVGRKKLPIYLILGPERFGKTTVLSQAGLDLIGAGKSSLDKVLPTKYCSFWFSQDALYVDTAGTYTKPDISRPRNDIIWRGFIRLMQKYFGKDAIAGILIVLDLPAIAQDKSLLRKTLFCVRERIYEMMPLVGKLNAHIVFTKCDRILGFSEFFASLDLEARTQPFGISFGASSGTNLVDLFENKFNELLQQVNNRIVENLHKSVRPQDRALIKAFPSQLGSLRQIFIEVISKIPNSRHINLSGMYFTSSIQVTAPIDLIKINLLGVFGLKERLAYNLEPNDNRSFFVEGIFKKAIHLPRQIGNSKLHLTFGPSYFKYIFIFLAAIFVIGAASIFGYKSYHKNLVVLDSMADAVRARGTNLVDDIDTVLGQLDQDAKSWWLRLGINKASSMHGYIAKKQRAFFVTILRAQLEGYLSKTLTEHDADAITKLYSALHVYLMLGKVTKMESGYVKSWFRDSWIQSAYSSDKRQYLMRWLDGVLQYKNAIGIEIEINQQLVAEVRDKLNESEPAQLVYLLLEGSYANKGYGLGFNRSIAKMYTSESFANIYKDSIPSLVAKLPKRDVILGDLKQLVDENAKDEIIEQVRGIYVERYIDAWINTLKFNVETDAKGVQGLLKYLGELAEDDSQLIKLLRQAKTNTNIEHKTGKLASEYKTKLDWLSSIDVVKLQRNLMGLKKYIANLASSSNPDEVIFESIAKYAEHQSANHPIGIFKEFSDKKSPLQPYLQEVAEKVLRVLMDISSAYVNNVWERTIEPKYKSTIADKYPLFKGSKDDIALEDFNNFFGPSGAIERFLNQYIKPIINVDKSNWTWKEIDGQNFNFSQDTIEVFLRAALIQKMFYSSKEARPKLQFTLVPIDLAPETQSFTLHVDGQKVVFADPDKKSYNLVWPGPQPGTVTMNFVDSQGRYFTTSEFGPWAWFRVLDKANVTQGNSTKTFDLTFDLNGNAARYKLTSTDAVNPFIPNVVSNFRCPEHLI